MSVQTTTKTSLLHTCKIGKKKVLKFKTQLCDCEKPYKNVNKDLSLVDLVSCNENMIGYCEAGDNIDSGIVII